MPQVLGHRSRANLARHTGTDSPPRAGFFVPIASAKSCMQPGAYEMAQPCGLALQVISQPSAATGNTWRGGRAPCTEQNAPGALGRGPGTGGRGPRCFCHDDQGRILQLA